MGPSSSFKTVMCRRVPQICRLMTKFSMWQMPWGQKRLCVLRKRRVSAAKTVLSDDKGNTAPADAGTGCRRANARTAANARRVMLAQAHEFADARGATLQMLPQDYWSGPHGQTSQPPALQQPVVYRIIFPAQCFLAVAEDRAPLFSRCQHLSHSISLVPTRSSRTEKTTSGRQSLRRSTKQK